MNLLLNILFIAVLLYIFYEDISDQKISLWALVLVFTMGVYLHYTAVPQEVFLTQFYRNISGVALLLVFLATYVHLRFKTGLFKLFGSGDAIFFVVLAVSLSTSAFVLLFVSSLVFSLVITLCFPKKIQPRTIPLAGLQALFFSLVFGVTLVCNCIQLYTY